jgi:hypothetical protein
VSMARALRGCVCVVAPAPPPPSALVVPLRDHVCSPPWGSGRGGVEVPLAPRRAALALRRGRPLTPPPPTRSSFPWLVPFALVVPLAPRSRSVVTVAEKEWQM